MIPIHLRGVDPREYYFIQLGSIGLGPNESMIPKSCGQVLEFKNIKYSFLVKFFDLFSQKEKEAVFSHCTILLRRKKALKHVESKILQHERYIGAYQKILKGLGKSCKNPTIR